MSRGCAAVLVLLSLHLLPATAEAQCPPGQQRPGINGRGWEENARVIINVDSNVFTDNKLNCIVAGPSRWNGTNGVVASPGLSSPTASLTIKCCMPTNFPGYDSPVVAGRRHLLCTAKWKWAHHGHRDIDRAELELHDRRAGL